MAAQGCVRDKHGQSRGGVAPRLQPPAAAAATALRRHRLRFALGTALHVLPSPPSLLHLLLQNSHAPAQKVKLATVQRQGQEVDVTVAAEALQPGDVALRIPEHLIVTLDRLVC